MSESEKIKKFEGWLHVIPYVGDNVILTESKDVPRDEKFGYVKDWEVRHVDLLSEIEKLEGKRIRVTIEVLEEG